MVTDYKEVRTYRSVYIQLVQQVKMMNWIPIKSNVSYAAAYNPFKSTLQGLQ